MPVDFLTSNQKEGYGRYSYEPNEAELAGCFHLDDRDISFVKTRRGDANQLGIALQLSTVRFLGTFLPDPTNAPDAVIRFIAGQIGVSEISCLPAYMDRKVTRYAHVNEIQQQYGYFEFNSLP
jgi:TnpA family transposase